VSIPSNTYFTETPATNFKSKAVATLNGVDYVFYIAGNNDLLVKVFGGVISYQLAVNARWVDTIQGTDRIHLYYTLRSDDLVRYLPFQHFGSGDLNPVATSISGASTTFSVNFAPNTVPPAYLLILNDGVNHDLFVSGDPDFSTIIGSKRTYSNALDHTFYVTRPTIAIHPQDTNIVTIHTQRIKIFDSTSKVGFYVVQIPGVV
jgi:hypothetical protein